MTNIDGRSLPDVVLSDPVTGVGYRGPSAADAALAKSYYDTATPITPGTDVVPGIGIGIVATVAGNVQLKLAAGTWTIPVVVGLTMLPIAVVGVVPAGTTAVAAFVKLS